MTKKQAELKKKKVKNELNILTVLQNWLKKYNGLPIFLFPEKTPWTPSNSFKERLLVVMTLRFVERRHVTSRKENTIFRSAFYENMQSCEMEILYYLF